MSRLIITADGLGANPQRTHGILQCMEFGVVTNAMLLPNAGDSDTAAKHARERGVEAGLLLNLTTDLAVSKTEDIPGLTESDGRFFELNKLFAQIESGAIEQSALEREIRAQVDWMFDAYGPPTHVASVENVHLHPRVIEALCGVLERYGLRFVRIPLEEPLPPFGFEVPEDRLAEIHALNSRAREARTLYAAHGITSSDHFRGSTLLGNASLKNLRHILSRFPRDGITELMTHPGSLCAYGTPFDLDPQRQTELRMLLDETIPPLLAQKRIDLCSFRDC